MAQPWASEPAPLRHSAPVCFNTQEEPKLTQEGEGKDGEGEGEGEKGFTAKKTREGQLCAGKLSTSTIKTMCPLKGEGVCASSAASKGRCFRV